MRSLAAELLAETRRALAAHGAQEVAVAQPWAERQGSLRGQPAVIYGYAWQTAILGWLRVSLLESAGGTRVFSALGLPRVQFDLPLFGAEMVMIKGAMTVVALDWMPLLVGARHVEGLAAIRARHDHFPAGGELPAWAAEAFSPHALFSRPREAVTEEAVRAAFVDYLEGYVALCAVARAQGDPQATLAAQRHYCEAHFTNDPGGNMLAAIFGAEWAEAYARAFLFRVDE